MADLTTHLHEQLEWHWRWLARPRLEGLTDEEYLWEPVPGTWSLRHRDQESPASVNRRRGSGEWVFEYGNPEPDPAPVTSIGWRLGHVIVGVLGMRAAAHFGGPAMDHDTFAFAGTAQEALDQLDEAYGAWSAGVRALTEEALAAPVGPAEGEFARELMLGLVLHINREVIHHLAEVALLRDLWAHDLR